MKKIFKIVLVSGLLLATNKHADIFAQVKPANTAKSGYYIDKEFNIVPYDKNGNQKIILITIDDGPSKYGKDMVKTLEKHDAKAIFFVNGIHDKNNPGNITAESKAGFLIGNHTWSHINLKNEKNKDKVKKEIDDNTALIRKLTGSNPKFFRAPYGMSSQYARDLVKKDAMIYMNWSGAALDWEKNTKDEKIFLKNVATGLHPGEILLIHEHEWTSKYLDDLLTELEKKGYSFADPNQISE
jgi:peptidoglycan/xylan/chitin deacetylase (PgdA/CDA1 family)